MKNHIVDIAQTGRLSVKDEHGRVRSVVTRKAEVTVQPLTPDEIEQRVLEAELNEKKYEYMQAADTLAKLNIELPKALEKADFLDEEARQTLRIKNELRARMEELSQELGDFKYEVKGVGQ